MPRDQITTSLPKIIAVASRDHLLLSELQEAGGRTGYQVVAQACSLAELAGSQWMAGASVVVVDLEDGRREQIALLTRLAQTLAGQLPIIVITEGFDAAMARCLLQLRVRDFLSRPVQAADILRSCDGALTAAAHGVTSQTDVLTFLPAAGGVGNTTIAVEAAIQLSDGGRRSVCLVDLDFHNNSCADFLDLEPRLDMAELGPGGERLDAQLLEVMLSPHASGVSLLAAPSRPGEPCDIQPQVIARILDVCAQRFDRLVIDLPRIWTAWTDDILAGSDRIFIVTDMTVPGLRCARRFATRVEERMGQGASPRIIVNRFQVGTLFGSGLRKSDVERALGSAFAGPVSNNYPLVREAIDRGVPLSTVKAGNRVSADLARILFGK